MTAPTPPAAMADARQTSPGDPVLQSRILARLDRWDEEHETSGCPSRAGDCIHSAAGALRSILQTLDNNQLANVAAACGVSD